jgi:hypothetical protein
VEGRRYVTTLPALMGVAGFLGARLPAVFLPLA